MKLIDNFLEVLYPRDLTCVLCGDESDHELCDICKGSLQFNIGSVCRFCGRMIMKSDYEVCHHCKGIKRYYDRGLSVTVYDELSKKLLFNLKYHDKRYISHTIAKYMLDYIVRSDIDIDFDVIVPVPLHTERYKSRGYNQAELICNHLSYLSGLPISKALERRKHTKPLNKLTADERLVVLHEAFELSSKVEGNIILVDDIFTTGSTLNACSKVLKESGAGYILIITFAVGE
ncbi:ComF family protein [Acidaminobacter sp. JC074]|uniref:ComF family protein n=1 Tax=Acidaminobacter sp. JC074 TaxID=2530199 RepID=UPI001F113EC8|nr:ComF family protein [Acidaminobacter sp. JC074]MCH4889304.1 ComF family protein [Acidaminobacter sp. JC074]